MPYLLKNARYCSPFSLMMNVSSFFSQPGQFMMGTPVIFYEQGFAIKNIGNKIEKERREKGGLRFYGRPSREHSRAALLKAVFTAERLEKLCPVIF